MNALLEPDGADRDAITSKTCHGHQGCLIGEHELAIIHRKYKRPFDLAVIVLSGILFAPLWLIACIGVPLAIWLEDGRPIIYRQTRLGRGGRSFQMLKFRSMIVGAEDSTGAVFSSRDDPRLTRVGRVIRELQLDEIPQIVNVVKGEMSLIGPRPERPEFARRFSEELPEFVQRLRVRPGIGGVAQARAGYLVSPRHKCWYDNFYLARMNPCLDFKLLVWCVLVSIKVRPRRRVHGRSGGNLPHP